ncbi:MAG: hypothetical protein AAF618_08075, partial [Pseudomonadota bacterium]
ASVTVISPSDAAREEGSSSLVFLPEEAAAAHAMESEASHREAAEALLKAMGAKKTARARKARAAKRVVKRAQPSFSVSSGTASKRSATRP